MFLENLKFNTSNDYLDDCSIEITLTFVSDALNKNEITTALGIEPTFAWNANEVLELGSSKKIRVADTGKWSLKSVTKIDNLDAGLELFLKIYLKIIMYGCL
ncbi:hypothetical protein K5I29_02150 [Flavobacterium agricola]|uniref:Uncharacterized protein n=1 Tax=Flavobacterium agricola TaxID=2870839 RepID=A0ABY6M3X5_9FLAO|nr:hypothetical protein [Flavobacterium agricola]UYW01748.1 hypothetical protein K5I29_02150 [Flavobacterium agricola]